MEHAREHMNNTCPSDLLTCILPKLC